MDIRTKALNQCYAMEGYKDLPLEEKNRIYDAVKAIIEEKEKAVYTYYMILRPVGIGSQPKGFIEFKNFDRRTYVPEINHAAWGMVTYNRQLTEKEMHDYDMIEKGE